MHNETIFRKQNNVVIEFDGEQKNKYGTFSITAAILAIKSVRNSCLFENISINYFVFNGNYLREKIPDLKNENKKKTNFQWEKKFNFGLTASESLSLKLPNRK